MRTGYGSYPVTRGEAVVGLLCLKDVLRLSAEERESTSVQGVMRPLTDAIVIDPGRAAPGGDRKDGAGRETRGCSSCRGTGSWVS